MPAPVLELKGLTIAYETEAGILEAARNVSLTIAARESYGLVGESGSGKTTLALGAISYLPPNGRVTAGRVLLDGADLLTLSANELRRIWGARIGVVYQNPATALNPSLSIGDQLAEMARLHLDMDKKAARRETIEILEKVAMPDPESVARRYPHQVSGGMLQRCVIAMALITQPSLLILDEPTTALDVTTQALVLDLVAELKTEFSSAILYITHDLGVVARICDRIGVMYAGELMEEGPIRALYKRPRHPYTLNLLGCVPRFELAGHRRSRLLSIPGFIPRLDELPAGCVFAPRCSFAEDACRAARPPFVSAEPGHLTACRRWSVIPPPEELEAAEGPFEPTGGGEEETRILDVRELKEYLPARDAGLSPFRSSKNVVKAVDGVTLWVNQARTLGLVGESGSGKTTVARVVAGLLAPTEGKLELEGHALSATTKRRSRDVLRRVQMVFQNPDASLNPRRSVSEAIVRPMILLGGFSRRRAEERVVQLLDAVHLTPAYYHRLPGELSGGEKQRVAIARAFAADPRLILCDEPLSSLDVSVQGALMNLLTDLQSQSGTSYLFISHDLAAVQHLSDWIAVMYLGRLAEWGSGPQVLNPPYHPYTEALLSAVPVADPDVEQQNIRLRGGVPSALDVPPGCRFHPRCPRYLGEVCRTQEPPWLEGEPHHWICCHIPVDELVKLQECTLQFGSGLESTPCDSSSAVESGA